jgi:leucyl aminopeptidase (aminopeptidase T)
MVEKGKIETGVVNMFQVSMGVKRGERITVVTDVPTYEEWMKKESTQLAEMVERSLLAKMVSEIATTSFPDCTVDFYAYPSVGKHGTEPGQEVEDKLKKADVAIAITSYSLSHTNARGNATKSGTRISSMPMFIPEMFLPGGPMAVDYTRIHEECAKIAALVEKAKDITLISPGGTALKFSLDGRKGLIDDGIRTEKGAFGNLPAGEVYTVPLEGTTNGKLVVEEGWYAGLTEDLTFIFKDGFVVEVMGGGKVGDEFRELLQCTNNEEPFLSRRNCAELGIGTNPNAKRPDNLLEAEKIRETVHIAIGDSSHMGGKVEADLHQDFVIPKPTLSFDGQIIIKEGKIVIV